MKQKIVKQINTAMNSLTKVTKPKRMRKLAKNLEDKYHEEEMRAEQQHLERRRLIAMARDDGEDGNSKVDEIEHKYRKYLEEKEFLIKQTELNENGSWVVVELSNGRPFKRANYRYNVKHRWTFNFLERWENNKLEVWIEEGTNLKKLLNTARPKKQKKSKSKSKSISKKQKKEIHKKYDWKRSFYKRVFNR